MAVIVDPNGKLHEQVSSMPDERPNSQFSVTKL
jgi:hypothetical protein